MIRYVRLGIAVLMMAGSASADPVSGDETYGLLFKNGTLDGIDRADALVYKRDVSNALTPDAADRDTGTVTLSFGEADTNAAMALLGFRKNGRERPLGSFPASVGNPMIMYFYESVVRDMAESTGGSPFYIRNRVKDALVAPSQIESGEALWGGKTITTQTIRMTPFEGDPNAERMQGFGDLELRVTMSDDVPGWYMSLVAAAQGGDVYLNALSFESLERTE